MSTLATLIWTNSTLLNNGYTSCPVCMCSQYGFKVHFLSVDPCCHEATTDPTGTGKNWPIDWEINEWVRDTSPRVHWNPYLIFRPSPHLTIPLFQLLDDGLNILTVPDIHSLNIFSGLEKKCGDRVPSLFLVHLTDPLLTAITHRYAVMDVSHGNQPQDQFSPWRWSQHQGLLLNTLHALCAIFTPQLSFLSFSPS